MLDDSARCKTKNLQEAYEITLNGIVEPQEVKVLELTKLDTSRPFPIRAATYISRRALQLYRGDKLTNVYPMYLAETVGLEQPWDQTGHERKFIDLTCYPCAGGGRLSDWPRPKSPPSNGEIKSGKKGVRMPLGRIDQYWVDRQLGIGVSE